LTKTVKPNACGKNALLQKFYLKLVQGWLKLLVVSLFTYSY